MNATINTDKWVENYGTVLYRYALARVSGEADAQDLVQDTFIAALKSKENFGGKSSEKTWLISILKHKILDYYRKAHRILSESTELAGDIDQVYNQRGMWKKPLPSWRKNPEQALDDKRFVGILNQCIQKLPENYRKAFVLKEIDDVSTEDICKALSISPTNLWVILHRARHKLRDCLEKNWFRAG